MPDPVREGARLEAPAAAQVEAVSAAVHPDLLVALPQRRRLRLLLEDRPVLFPAAVVDRAVF